MKELEASLEEAKQLKDQSVSTMMKERVKLREAQDDAEMFKKSTVELGKRNNLLEVCAYTCVSVIHTSINTLLECTMLDVLHGPVCVRIYVHTCTKLYCTDTFQYTCPPGAPISLVY